MALTTTTEAIGSDQSLPLTPFADHFLTCQQTLAQECQISGIGYITGADVTVRLLPAPADYGVVFIRVDLPGQPEVPAIVENVAERTRRTGIEANGTSIEMTEHLLAALAGLGVDNCRVEIDAGELPGLDGSSLAFVEAIQAAGLVTCNADRKPLVITESHCVSDSNGAMVAVHPGPSDHLIITYNLDYENVPGVGAQSFSLRINPASFTRDLAAARTFVLRREVEALKQAGIGTRSTASDLLVFDDDGSLIDNELRYANECVRHKMLDVVGDFALMGRPLCGHIVCHRSGHALNTKMVQEIKAKVPPAATSKVTKPKERSVRPLLDAVQIENIMPHRYPFVLLDRVVELEPNQSARGFKNVTVNEPFFPGHWPGRPVMPGVLIIEAMAQLGGVMLTKWKENGRYAMIIAIDDIKLRRPVCPGDRLWLEADAIRVKSRTALIETKALVEEEVVAEAKFKLILVSSDEEFDA